MRLAIVAGVALAVVALLGGRVGAQSYSGQPNPYPVTKAPVAATAHLTSSSTTGCNSISVSAVALLGMNADAAAGTDVALYDEGASPGCNSADRIIDPTLTANQVLTFSSPYGHVLLHGLAYKATTASLTANVWIDYR